MSTEKKVLSVRVDARTIEKLNRICMDMDMSQAEFIATAIEETEKNARRKRCGGLNVAIMNPQFTMYTPEEAREIVQTISETANRLTKINPALDFALHEVATYAAQRFFKDTEEQKENFYNIFHEYFEKGETEE